MCSIFTDGVGGVKSAVAVVPPTENEGSAVAEGQLREIPHRRLVHSVARTWKFVSATVELQRECVGSEL